MGHMYTVQHGKRGEAKEGSQYCCLVANPLDATSILIAPYSVPLKFLITGIYIHPCVGHLWLHKEGDDQLDLEIPQSLALS